MGKIRRIGIALAAYRPDPAVFAEQLQSIRAQTWPAWFCVVTFDSPLSEWRDHPASRVFFEDLRFTWLENETRLGSKQNFGRAMREVAGQRDSDGSLRADAIACADQDDIWYPQKLDRLAHALETRPPLSLVHSDMHVLGPGGVLPETAWRIERRGVGNVALRHLLVRNVVAGAAMLLDAELVRRYPEIPDEAEYHDHWYAAVASAHGGVYPVAEPLFAYRQHGGNVVGVSPYQGRFWTPDSVRGLGDVLRKCKSGYAKSRRLAESAERAGLLRSGVDREIFLSRRDCGAGLFTMAIRNWFKDPPLSRACLARAVGKFLTG